MDRKYKQSFTEFAQVSVAVSELYKFTKDPHILRAGTSAIGRGCVKTQNQKSKVGNAF
jgi:hypothetical protein